MQHFFEFLTTDEFAKAEALRQACPMPKMYPCDWRSYEPEQRWLFVKGLSQWAIAIPTTSNIRF